MINRKRVLLLALILILTSTIVYSPHLVTPFPLHADEWHHIELVRSGSISATQERLFADITLEAENIGAPRYGS